MHGNLAYAWDDGRTAGRRFAAVSLMRIKAATQLEIAAAFAVRPAKVRRWDATAWAQSAQWLLRAFASRASSALGKLTFRLVPINPAAVAVHLQETWRQQSGNPQQ